MALRLSEVEEIHCSNGIQLVDWLGHFKFFTGKRVHIVKNTNEELYVRIYTARNCYAIHAIGDQIREPEETGDGVVSYLGCVASRRTPRPGEDWTRGNDLPDGRFCKGTLNRILGAIVFYEAVEVSEFPKVARDMEQVEGIEIGENIGFLLDTKKETE